MACIPFRVLQPDSCLHDRASVTKQPGAGVGVSHKHLSPSYVLGQSLHYWRRGVCTANARLQGALSQYVAFDVHGTNACKRARTNVSHKRVGSRSVQVK